MRGRMQTGTDNLEAMEEARNYNAYLLSLAQRAGDGLVLDFGAGHGTFARAMAADRRAVVCIEPDATARTRLLALGLEAHADLAATPQRQFDGIYSFNVLEHIEDDEAALRALYDRLRPGGRIVIYVPAFPVLFSAMDRLVGHHRRYVRGPLVEMMTRAGFRIGEARYVDSLGFFAALLFRFSGGGDGRLSPRSVALYDRMVFPASRALDALAGRWFGKNLLVDACKPG